MGKNSVRAMMMKKDDAMHVDATISHNTIVTTTQCFFRRLLLVPAISLGPVPRML
jgi:hypothetical protein